ncbi:hypothetical protein GTQ34_16065 [Muricauda sp. JGD-17]|uniref:Uncharacterized protein n=1 Tax=Flagellimonas ochracea TaxID=2696472 RepID=A0A964WYX8_9FLAO|nr:hypothetical protein [Allomuricauda ochracea]NAY93427.1 hypothetical protein [Allomuricauda ochracea]
MPKLNRIKLLNFKERLEAYTMPYYVFVTGSSWTFYKRLDKEFIKKTQEFERFGEIEKAKEFKELKAVAIRNFRLFTWAVVLIGFLIVILTSGD